MGERAVGGRGTDPGQLPFPPAQWRPDDALHLHLSIQDDLARKRPAGRFERAQPAAPICQAHNKNMRNPTNTFEGGIDSTIIIWISFGYYQSAG